MEESRCCGFVVRIAVKQATSRLPETRLDLLEGIYDTDTEDDSYSIISHDDVFSDTETKFLAASRKHLWTETRNTPAGQKTAVVRRSSPTHLGALFYRRMAGCAGPFKHIPWHERNKGSTEDARTEKLPRPKASVTGRHFPCS